MELDRKYRSSSGSDVESMEVELASVNVDSHSVKPCQEYEVHCSHY